MMQTNSGQISTTELTTIGGASSSGYWIGNDWYPFGYPTITTPVTYYYQTIQEPQNCIGKAHVFECDHEPKCKCGKIQRVMPKVAKKR